MALSLQHRLTTIKLCRSALNTGCISHYVSIIRLEVSFPWRNSSPSHRLEEPCCKYLLLQPNQAEINRGCQQFVDVPRPPPHYIDWLYRQNSLYLSMYIHICMHIYKYIYICIHTYTGTKQFTGSQTFRKSRNLAIFENLYLHWYFQNNVKETDKGQTQLYKYINCYLLTIFQLFTFHILFLYFKYSI